MVNYSSISYGHSAHKMFHSAEISLDDLTNQIEQSLIKTKSINLGHEMKHFYQFFQLCPDYNLKKCLKNAIKLTRFELEGRLPWVLSSVSDVAASYDPLGVTGEG